MGRILWFTESLQASDSVLKQQLTQGGLGELLELRQRHLVPRRPPTEPVPLRLEP